MVLYEMTYKEGWVTHYDTIRGDNGVVTLLQKKLDGRLFIEA